MKKIVNTPTCPICLRNYSCIIIPKILYPCGHGMCNKCIVDYREHMEENENDVNELKCPQCREIIVQEFENYDLQHITNNVSLNTLSYWSKRLVQAIDTRGITINIDEKMVPFCKTLFTRIVYNEDLKTLEYIKSDDWSECDRQRVKSLSKTFINALSCSEIDVDEALNWISVLNMPQGVEIKMLKAVNKFYTTKHFLKQMNAEWLLNTLYE